MRRNAVRKQQNTQWPVLRLVRSPDDVMEKELAQRIYGLRIPDGHVRPSRFYKVCCGRLFPAATISKMTDDAIEAGCDEDAFVDAITIPIETMIRDKYRHANRRPAWQMDSGEFPTPPDAPAQIKAA
ncbi:MAG: hypothetical protein JWL61_5017 [Gemmatimonadetes bacterium]|nr:hypothetical protein [Gemmatimonadota bacterium]